MFLHWHYLLLPAIAAATHVNNVLAGAWQRYIHALGSSHVLVHIAQVSDAASGI